MVKTALEVRRRLKQDGIVCALVNLRFARPLDTQMLSEAAGTYELAVTMEENVKTGGVGEAVSEYFRETGADIRVLHIAVADTFVTHGNVEILKQQIGLDAQSIAEKIKMVIK